MTSTSLVTSTLYKGTERERISFSSLRIEISKSESIFLTTCLSIFSPIRLSIEEKENDIRWSGILFGYKSIISEDIVPPQSSLINNAALLRA